MTDDLQEVIKNLQERIKQLEIQLAIQPNPNDWTDWNKDHEPEFGRWIVWSNNKNDGQLTKAKRINNIFYTLWWPDDYRLGRHCWKWWEFEHWGEWKYCKSPE